MKDRVSCLTSTYGRHSRMCDALGMFLAQDHPNRELVILNSHEVPLVFDHPLVRIINEPSELSLGDCRNRLLDFADGDFVRTWDDDDLYLPWCISQGVDYTANGQAWKPKRSWFTTGGEKFELAGNSMEASVNWRRDVVDRIGFLPNTMGDEHTELMKQAKISETEMGAFAGYCYKWGCGEYHTSGSLGSNRPLQERIKEWRARNQDVRPGEALVPTDPTVWWRKMLRFVPEDRQKKWARLCSI